MLRCKPSRHPPNGLFLHNALPFVTITNDSLCHTHHTLLLRPSGDHQTLNYPWPLYGLSNHFFWSYREITGVLSTSRHSGHRAGPTTCPPSSDLLPWVTQTLKDKRTCAMRLSENLSTHFLEVKGRRFDNHFNDHDTYSRGDYRHILKNQEK